MTPYTLFAVIIYARLLLAFRAAPLKARAVFYPDINSSCCRIKLNFGHFPWTTKAKNGLIKFRISHWPPPSKEFASPILQHEQNQPQYIDTPTENCEEPKRKRKKKNEKKKFLIFDGFLMALST